MSRLVTNNSTGAGEVAQQVRAPAALLEVLSIDGLPPSIMGSDVLFWHTGVRADRALNHKTNL